MTVEPAATGPAGSPARIDPLRHPAALSNAISRGWRPYRFRAYVLGALAGFLFGGVVAPIATTLVALVLVLTTSLPVLTVQRPAVDPRSRATGTSATARGLFRRVFLVNVAVLLASSALTAACASGASGDRKRFDLSS